MTEEDFLKEIKNPAEKDGIIEKIRMQKIPLVIWGGGSMSQSVRNLLKKEGIAITACWIDNCSKNEIIDGIPVMELEDIHKKINRFNVVCGHSRYELADEVKEKFEFINEIYCLVNVCYGQWRRITYDFIVQYASEYKKTYEILEDDKSRKCMTAFLNCKLNENHRYLLPCCDEKISYFKNPFFQITEREAYVDVGAYNGDTIEEFLKTVSSYDHIYALEPEKNNYLELVKYGKLHQLNNVVYYPYGSWNDNVILKFMETEESSSIKEDGGTTLRVFKLDTLLSGKKITLIKINFLNGVGETLQGAERILREQKPKLAITVGFDEWGVMKIPRIIKRINSDYKIYLRYETPMPARLILFAV